MSFPLFIARKIYSHKADDKRISRPAILIATLGVAIGLAVMIVSVCVVLGFQNEVKSKVMGFGSHIQILNSSGSNSYESHPVSTNDSLIAEIKKVNGVKHIQRFAIKPGLLKTDDAFQGIMLKGVGADFDTTFIASHLVAGTMPRFSEEKSTNKVVISNRIAKEMNIKVGDRIYAYFIENNIRARRFDIVGIYQTNLAQYDKLYVFADLYTVQRLNNWEQDMSTGLEITVNDMEQLEEIDDKIITKVNHKSDKYGNTYSTYTIQELCPQIFGWLGLLDLNVWVILILMVCVAGFTMISGLLIIILERTNMIGILKALGAGNGSIRRVFLYFSSMIIGKAMLWGNIIGLGLVILQWQFGLVHLNPENYYVDAVPVLLNPILIIALNVATLIISVLVLILPSYIISRIHPAKSIRFE